MTKRQIENKISDAKDLFLNPVNAKQRQYEAIRAIVVDSIDVETSAKLFGYKPSTLETMLSQIINQKTSLFPEVDRKPKTRKIPKEAHSRITAYRNEGLSASDIQKKLSDENIKVTTRTVERILKDLGYTRLKRRTNETLGISTKNTFIPQVSAKLNFENLAPFSTDCPASGVFFLLPYIVESGILKVIEESSLPESSVIGTQQACLSMLLFKLLGGNRLSQIQAYDHEVGLGLFAGLNVLPKSSYMSTYSCRCSEEIVLDFQKEIMKQFTKTYPEMYFSNIINLDFHSIPHFGEESEMEKVWCGARGKTMKGANTVIAHDSGSNAIMYTRADILRKDEALEVKKFIEYWKEIKGNIEETLIFDCKFTTYEVLNEISSEVKFITLRKRNAALLQETIEIPDADWHRIHLPIKKRKRNNVSFCEKTVMLSNCDKEFRQIIIKDHGRVSPTFIITNDFSLPVKQVLILYAQRWHVEQKIAELVSFFNLNALSSPLMIRIHFDIIWTVVADTIYHALAKDLKRFEKCLSPTIFRKFINMPGKITYDGNSFTLLIRKRAHTPVLMDIEKLKGDIKIPWLEDKTLKIKWLP